MTDDRIYERLDDTCKKIHEIMTDVALIKKDINYMRAESKQKKTEKIQKRDYITGLGFFIFFAYIAVKDIVIW